MTSRIAQLTLDVVDPDRMAEFWSLTLGYRVVADEGDEDFVVLVDPECNELCDLAAPAEDLDG